MPSLLVSMSLTDPPSVPRIPSVSVLTMLSTKVLLGFLAISFCWASTVSAKLFFMLPRVTDSYLSRRELYCISTALAWASMPIFSNCTVTVSPR